MSVGIKLQKRTGLAWRLLARLFPSLLFSSLAFPCLAFLFNVDSYSRTKIFVLYVLTKLDPLLELGPFQDQ